MHGNQIAFVLTRALLHRGLAAAFICVLCTSGECKTLWVAPNGKDANSGTRSAPFATIEAALASGPGNLIRVLPGEYRRNDALIISAANNGTTIEAADPGSPPVITGGRRIAGFEPFERGIWRAKASFHFEQLWVNGVRAQRARTPNSGWLYMAAPLGYAKDPRTGAARDFSRQAFRMALADTEQVKRIPAKELQSVEMTVWHSWSISRHQLLQFEGETRTAFLRTESQWPFFHFGANQRYQLGNYLAAVDEPGEWFLSGDGWLYYMPRPREDMRRAEVIAPILEQWVIIRGAQNVTLRNLRFEHSGEALPGAGVVGLQAAAESSGAIIVENASGIALERLHISKTGGYGVWFRRGVQDSRLTGSVLEELGAGGVRVGETSAMPEREQSTERISVDGNLIQAGGRENPGAVGILVGHSGKNRLLDNEINDFFYSGISIGWTWGYGKSVATGNLVQGNYIHHIGQGRLSDMGGIYLLGVAQGTAIRGNVIHDVMSYDQYGRGGWGIYADEGTSQVRVEDNLVYRTSSGGFHQHYGRENLVRHNVFAFGKDAQVERTRAEDHVSFRFFENIVLTEGAPLFAGAWSGGEVEMDRNVYFDVGRRPMKWGQLSFAEWQSTGRDRSSLIADPGFRAPLRGDFRVLAGSLAQLNGFEGMSAPGSRAVTTRFPLVPRSQVKVVQPAPEPPPPKLDLDENFDLQREGTKPAFAVVSVEGRGDSIEVSRANARSGAQALRMTDAPGLKHAHDPFFFYRPHHRDGVTRVRFAGSFDIQGNFYHEWRDASTPYRVGPSFGVRAGRIEAGGRDLGPLKSGKWARFSVEVRLGVATDRSWTLTVEEEGVTSRCYTLPLVDAQWATLDWLGFVSNAFSEAVTWLDDIEVHNRPESANLTPKLADCRLKY